MNLRLTVNPLQERVKGNLLDNNYLKRSMKQNWSNRGSFPRRPQLLFL